MNLYLVDNVERFIVCCFQLDLHFGHIFGLAQSKFSFFFQLFLSDQELWYQFDVPHSFFFWNLTLRWSDRILLWSTTSFPEYFGSWLFGIYQRKRPTCGKRGDRASSAVFPVIGLRIVISVALLLWFAVFLKEKELFHREIVNSKMGSRVDHHPIKKKWIQSHIWWWWMVAWMS